MRTKNSTPCRERRVQALAIASALLIVGFVTPVAAEQSPREVVQSTSDEVLAVLAEKDLSKQERRDKGRTIGLRSMDFETLRPLVPARHRGRVSPPPQHEVMQEFHDHPPPPHRRP